MVPMGSTKFMDSLRWKRLRTLFDAALDLDTSDHALFIDALSEDDRDLRVDLQRLLLAHARVETQSWTNLIPLAAALVVNSDAGAQSIARRALQQVGPPLVERELECLMRWASLKLSCGESLPTDACGPMQGKR